MGCDPVGEMSVSMVMSDSRVLLWDLKTIDYQVRLLHDAHLMQFIIPNIHFRFNLWSGQKVQRLIKTKYDAIRGVSLRLVDFVYQTFIKTLFRFRGADSVMKMQHILFLSEVEPLERSLKN